MNRTFGWAVVAMSVAFGLTVMAGEKAPVDFQDMMKANQVLTGPMGLRGHVPAKDYDAIVKDATTLKENFVKIEAFFTQRKTEDAIAFSKASLKIATDLETAAKAKDDAGIAAAQMALTPSCMACHMVHRERMPDGTSEIK